MKTGGWGYGEGKVCAIMAANMVLAERLREIRVSKKLSQAEVEKKAGLLRCYLSRVENGREVPAVEVLEKLARALEVPLYYIFYDGSEPPLLPSGTGRKPTYKIVKGSEARAEVFKEKLRRLMARMGGDEQQFLCETAEKLLESGKRGVRQSSTAGEKQIIGEYHRLVDRKLQGNASAKDLAELERIEGGMQVIENEQTSGIEEVLEQRHRTMMEKLTNLTEELRRNTTVTER